MIAHLKEVSIPVEIYRYDPHSQDVLYEQIKAWFLSQDIATISLSGIKSAMVPKLKDAMYSEDIKQLTQLLQVDGVGIKTIEKLVSHFHKRMQLSEAGDTQQQLF